MDDKVIRVFEIVNVKGLHARASAKFSARLTPMPTA